MARRNTFQTKQRSIHRQGKISYHHSCYREFTRMKTPQQRLDNAAIQSKNDVLESFMLMLRIKIIRDKYAFLLNELLSDIKLISLEHGLSEPIITNTCTLKRKIIDAFPDEIDFFPQGKYLIVLASDINPCKYAISTLRGSGLRDRDIIRSFASLVKRLVKERDLPEPPKTAEDFDNNDGRQETLTGTGTTHDTNQTLSQTPSTRQLTELKTIGILNEKTIDFGKTINDIDMFDDDEIGYYNVNDKLEPQPIKEIRDDENCRSELEACLKKDVLWSLSSSLPENCTEGETLQKLGSWTAFNRVAKKLKPLPNIQELMISILLK